MTDIRDYYKMKDFTVYPLYKSRQITNGILTPVKNSIKSGFKIIKHLFNLL